MKANRKTLPADESGVSAVIGAILVAGLLATVLVTIQVSFVPVWEREAEAGYMVLVQRQLAEFRSQIDEQTLTSNFTTVSSPVSLGRASGSAFATVPTASQIAFRPGISPVNVSAERLSILLSNGSLLAIADNQWEGIPSSTQVTDIGQVAALRIRAQELSSNQAGKAITIVITGPDGSFAGSFRISVAIEPPDLLVTLRTVNAKNELLSTIATAFHQTTSFTPFFVNALDTNYVFDQVLAAAPRPFSLTLTHDPGFPADYSIAFLQTGPDGELVLVGSGGALLSPFSRAYAGGVVTLTARNNYFVDQTYTIENGALILEQEDGAVFKVPPAVTFTQVQNTTRIVLGLPNLVGDAFSFSTSGLITLSTLGQSRADFLGLTPALTIAFDTSYPNLWSEYLGESLDAAGLSSQGTQPQYVITTGAGRVSVTIYGAFSDPGSLTNDISLRLTQAQLSFTAST